MKSPALNLHDIVILIADPNGFARRIVHGMLRGFGANKLIEVEHETNLIKVLSGQKIDILICDERLPPDGGLSLTHSIRWNVSNEHRTIPILLMTGDAREKTVKRARDVGANMVVAKPMSPKSLYDRLSWIAFKPRNFIDAPTYFGPDRRFKLEGYPSGVGRRKEDRPVEVTEEVGPALEQDDIDSLFNAIRSGQS